MWRLVAVLGGLLFSLTIPDSASHGVGSSDATTEGLKRLERSGFRDAWVRPGTDFADYTKITLAAPEVRYRREPRDTRYRSSSSNFALSEPQMESFKRYLTEALEAELAKSDHYELSPSSGPEVLLIQPSVIDLVVKVPTFREPGRSNFFTRSTADITLRIELRDSQSGDILARMEDRKEARQVGRMMTDLYWSNSVSDAAAVRNVFRRWARILRRHLDEVHSVGSAALAAGR